MIHELLLITEVERRVIRACKTLRAVPDRSFEATKSAWPEVLQVHEEAYGYTEVAMPKFRPKPFDVGDMLVALDWVRVLSKKEFKIIWWRSFDVSFRQIGIRLHRSDETARRQYKDIMLRVWHEANRAQAAGRPRVPDVQPRRYRSPSARPSVAG